MLQGHTSTLYVGFSMTAGRRWIRSQSPLILLPNAGSLQWWFSDFLVCSRKVPVPAVLETSEMALQGWKRKCSSEWRTAVTEQTVSYLGLEWTKTSKNKSTSIISGHVWKKMPAQLDGWLYNTQCITNLLLRHLVCFHAFAPPPRLDYCLKPLMTHLAYMFY